MSTNRNADTRKYAALGRHLAGTPREQQIVTLPFDEIEKIICAKLPQSAFTYPAWWANQDGGSRAPHWHAAGFIVDQAELARKVVRFKRDTRAQSRPRPGAAKRAKKTKAVSAAEKSAPLAADTMLRAGFQEYGFWELKDGRIHLRGDIPTAPAVYAHVVDGEIFYIGSATMGLKKRLYFYGRPGKGQRTSIRINELITKELEKGRSVTLIAAMPEGSSWNGLPVDQVTGLETGLIKAHTPPWNKRGIAG